MAMEGPLDALMEREKKMELSERGPAVTRGADLYSREDGLIPQSRDWTEGMAWRA